MILRFVPYLLLGFIGIANALPVPLTSSNLSLYLSDKGFGLDAIGLFSLLAIPLSFKLLWSPLVDTCSLPFFSKSPRKGWMVFALLGMAISLCGLGLFDPLVNSFYFGASLFMLCSFTGCLYIVGLAYELESIDESAYSLGSASIVAGYRAGLLIAGAGVLYMAYLYSWPMAFLSMAGVLVFGSIVIAMQPEPYKSHGILKEKRERFSSYSSLSKAFWQETIFKPCKEFFQRQDWVVIILVLLLFKSGNHMVRAMEGPFYLEIGFSKADLALAAKTWGFFTTIAGAFVAGIFLKDRDHKRSIAFFGMLHACAILGYWLQAIVGKSYPLLYATSALINSSGGMAMTAFTLCLWKTCSKEHAAVQYALFWSFFTFNTNLLACFGGFLAAAYSWDRFFLIASSIGIISSLLLLLAVSLQQRGVLYRSHGSRL